VKAILSRNIIKVSSDGLTASERAVPVGTIATTYIDVDYPGWAQADGRVFTQDQWPELFAVIGKSYVTLPLEGLLQRWVRRALRLPGPEAGLRLDEARLPDLRGHA